ncbi:MAG: Fic family protein [Clostridiaceae bacterium]|nr:Fic family protein [Clostridiaceae bacterium]
MHLHKIFYELIDANAAGKYRSENVFITGTDFVPTSFSDVPKEMDTFISSIKEEESTLHPVIFSAYLHLELVRIHPFVDGNGRTARLLTNLSLIRNGYLPISIPPILRSEYINSIQLAQKKQNPSPDAFYRFVCLQEIEEMKAVARNLDINIVADN